MSLWKPYLDENIQNPYPMYKRLREESPVYQASNGDYIITRYDHVKQILASNNFLTGVRLDWLESNVDQLSKYSLNVSPLKEAMEAFLLFINPPRHTRIRDFISRVWDDRAIEESIQEHINELLQNCHGAFDFVEEYAKPLPAMTIAHILGIPKKEAQLLKLKTDHLFKLLDVYISIKEMQKMLESVKEITDFLKKVIEQKRQQLDNSLISKIIAQNEKENHLLSDIEVMSVCFLLFSAGTETTSGLIGNGMLALLGHPSAIAKLRNDPSLWDIAIEEILRYDAPAQLSVRKSVKEYQIGSHTIPASSTVVVAIGSANHDELKFAEPHCFKLDRIKNQHLSFGGGRHYCLGDWLGRKQAKMAFKTFFETFSQVEINGVYQYNKNITIRSLKHLPLLT